MISEGSCDTEDWSDIFLKFLFVITEINNILKYIYIEKSYLMCNISQYYWLLNSSVFLVHFVI